VIRIALFAVLLVLPASAQQLPDYQLQRDIAIDTAAQCYALWTARGGDLQKLLREQQARIAELEKQLAAKEPSK
jgi:Zn-finger nucleic acid-binding protein